MKKAPKKKVPGYFTGGTTVDTKGTPADYKSKRRTSDKTTFGSAAKDIGLALVDSATTEWAPNLVKNSDYSETGLGATLAKAATIHEPFSSQSLTSKARQLVSPSDKYAGMTDDEKATYDKYVPVAKAGAKIARAILLKIVGFKNGGTVSSEKAKKILKDNSAHGKPLTDKQKGYFGLIAGGGTPKKSEGGEIEGPGTSKSDSIKAKVKPGSFVVPAENAHVAEMIRTHLLGSKNKKANLDQKSGSDVKLSDGEHLFTPEEKDELMEHGIDLKKLAPDADENNEEKDEDEFAKGGEVGDDPIGDIKKENAARAKSQSDANEKAKKERSAYQAEQSLENILRDIDRIKEAYRKGDKKFDGQDIDEALNDLERSYNYSQQKYKEATGKNYTSPYRSSNASDQNKSAKPLNTPNKSASSVPNKAVTKTNKQPVNKTVVSKLPTDSSSLKSPDGAVEDVDITKSSGYNKKVDDDIAAKNQAAKKPPINGTQADLDLYKKDLAAAEAAAKSATDKGPGKGNSSVFNKTSQEDVLAAGQIGLGLYSLLKDGKRPIDKIDPDFNASVDAAKTAATYGFDPATKNLYEKQIDQQRLGAVNVAAQTAAADPTKANAFARAATNTYGDNLVKMAAADANLRMQKQQYFDQLIRTRANMRRRLFEDSMRAFEMNQNAGANLLSSGIENYFGNKWRKDQQQAINEANANSNINY